jgi:hypothetical protein
VAGRLKGYPQDDRHASSSPLDVASRMPPYGSVQLQSAAMRTVHDSARQEQSRGRISRAFLDLIAEGNVTPATQAVAERAQVDVRSVSWHFTEMETHCGEAARHGEWEARGPISGACQGTSLQGLVEAFVARRVAIYERLMPFQTAAPAHLHQSPCLRHHGKTFSDLHRDNLREHLPASMLNDHTSLDALALATSIDTWTQLRQEQRIARTHARRIVVMTCMVLLERPRVGP